MFQIYNKTLDILVSGQRANEYIISLTDLELNILLKEYKSWHGFVESNSSGPVDCSEHITRLEDEIQYRNKLKNKFNSV